VKQAHWQQDGVALVDVEPPPLPEGWARLRVAACGICGTDLHMLRQHFARMPGVGPGHEMVGYPLDGPAGLADALYAVEPRTWCGECAFCSSGSRHLCARGTLLGVNAPGGLAEFVDAPVASLHAMSGDMQPVVASLAEPFAVCVRAIQLAEIQIGSRVLVLGAGTIGLLTGLLARDRAESVAISARHSHQRAAAKQLGITPLAEDQVAAWALEHGPDVVIETVGGRADTVDQAVRLCRSGGRVVVVGVFAGAGQVNLLLLMAKELAVVGSNTYGTDRRGAEFASAVRLLPRYVSELGPLQTHQLPLDQISEAFATADDKKSGAIKVTLLPS
jgi:threonine dehydrogenase-like Zn-dependent dehydrogenase